MPTYEYACGQCGLSYEEWRFMCDPAPVACPNCSNTEAFRQVYDGGMVVGIVKGEPTTVGQQAELNAKRLGKEQMQMRAEAEAMPEGFQGKLPENAKVLKRPHKNYNPWYRSGEFEGLPRMKDPLDLSKIKDVNKYVITGET